MSDDIDVIKKKIKEAEGKTEPEKGVKNPLLSREKTKRKRKTAKPEEFHIEGYVLLMVSDTVFPFAFSFINNMLDSRVKISSSALQLNEKDFSKLEPLADQAAEFLTVHINPVVGFAIVSTFMYSNNLMIARMSAEAKLPKEEKADKPKRKKKLFNFN